MKQAIVFTISSRCLYESIGEAFSKQYVLTENFFTLILSELLGATNIPVITLTDDANLAKTIDSLGGRYPLKNLSMGQDHKTILENLNATNQVVFVDISSCLISSDTLQGMILRQKGSETVCLNSGGALATNDTHAENILRIILANHSQASVLSCFDSYLKSIQWQGVDDFTSNHVFEKPFLSNADFSFKLKSYQQYILQQYMKNGLSVLNPASIDLRGHLRFGKNVFLDNNISIRGEVDLGDNITVGTNCILENTSVKNGTQIKENCIIISSEIGGGCRLGPYARLRSHTRLGEESQIGNFVEIKNARLGKRCKINHHSFIGDAILGNNVIIGAGSVTCNFDGNKNNETIIGDNVFIGSGVQLIAPVHLSNNSFVAAGSAITQDVPSFALAIARSKQIDIENWVKTCQQMINADLKGEKMEKWKSIVIDDPKLWPKTTHVVMDDPHIDNRGSIQSLVNFPVKNISLITSKKGSIRSNHYHKNDWHYMYMLSGKAEYYFRPTGTDEPLKMVIFKQGDLVFTPPLEDHVTVFLEDSTFLAMSRNPRDQQAYESDVVRVSLIENFEDRKNRS